MEPEPGTDREPSTPRDGEELAAIVAEAARTGQPLRPCGGGTALDAVPDPAPRSDGDPRSVRALSLDWMNACREHAVRDLTVTVEAGMPLAALDVLLAEAGQRLGVECARPEHATVGGALACDASGPRAFGNGTLRDALIGVTAVDGRGRRFRAGGRVVKNVAGYDFMKLLIGSRGSLAVITEATFKVGPRPAAVGLLLVGCEDASRAERAVEALMQSAACPVALELLDASAASALAGPIPPGAFVLAIAVEGSTDAVDWQLERLDVELDAVGAQERQVFSAEAANDRLRGLVELPHAQEDRDWVELRTRPSRVPGLVAALAGGGSRVNAGAGTGRVQVTLATGAAGEAARARLARAVVAEEAVVRPWRWSGGGTTAPRGRVSEAAESLAARLEAVFDPAAILPPLGVWPGRSVREGVPG